VKQSHPYIGARDDNRFRVLRRGALKLACSLMHGALRWCKFRPRVNVGLIFWPV